MASPGAGARVRQRGGERVTVTRVALALALLGSLEVACRRSSNEEKKPAPAVVTSPPVAAPPEPHAAGGGAPDAHPPAATGEGLIICTDTRDERVVQRVVLPDGDAFVITRQKKVWSVSEGQRLDPAALGKLEAAFTERHFFELPEHVSANAVEGPQWELRFATRTRRHESQNFAQSEREAPDHHALYALCEETFAGLPSSPSDLQTAIGVYRTLEDYAKTLAPHDPRRDMLIEWLDSLQADFASP